MCTLWWRSSKHQNHSFCVDTTEARTDDLPYSNRWSTILEPTIYHTPYSNRRFIILEPTIYHTRTDDLPYSNRRSTILEPTIYHTRTDDLSYSNRWSTILEPTIYHTRTDDLSYSNRRSTILDISTFTITQPMWVFALTIRFSLFLILMLNCNIR